MYIFLITCPLYLGGFCIVCWEDSNICIFCIVCFCGRKQTFVTWMFRHLHGGFTLLSVQFIFNVNIIMFINTHKYMCYLYCSPFYNLICKYVFANILQYSLRSISIKPILLKISSIVFCDIKALWQLLIWVLSLNTIVQL